MVRGLKKIVLLLSIIFLSISLFGFTPSTKFELDNSNDTINFDVSHYSNLAKVIIEPSQKPKFYAFDVNSEGNIAIALNDSKLQGVLVYDKYGEYIFGLEIDSQGSIIVEWNEPNINVVFLRSNIIATYDSNGNCLNVARFIDNAQNGEYADYLRTSVTKTDGNDEFIVASEEDFWGTFSSQHKQLLRIDTNGSQMVIYESNISFWSADMFEKILLFVVASIVLATFVIKVRRQYVANMQTHHSPDNS